MAASFPIAGPMRSALLAGLVAIGVTGCQDLGSVYGANSDFGKLGALLFHQIAGIGSSASVPRERAASIPYASLGVRLGGSDESMFVLASQNGENLLWIGGKTLAVTTRHGRVVRTVGFRYNVSGVLPAQSGQTPASPTIDYLYDFAEQSRYGIPVKCVRRDLGQERIVIIGVSHDTNHLAEDCSATGMDWSFRNEFWTDAAGYTWKSRQFVEPRLDPLSLEVLRPAG